MSHSDTQEILASLMKEAVTLRFEESIPPSGAGPQEVLESLLACRRRADRLEGLYLRTLNIRGQLSRIAYLDKVEAEEEWATSLVKIKNSPAYRGENFSGPRERYAEADLETLEYKRKSHKSSELLEIANEAVDIIRTALRGLNDTRQDHNSWIRSLHFQSTLEQ